MENNLSNKALALFKRISLENGLSFRVDESPEEAKPIEFFFILPKQEGLDFEICLYLENLDELHISMDDFWVEFFPFGKGGAEKYFREAVNGLIKGECRLVKYYSLLFSKHFKTNLERRNGKKWKTVNTYVKLRLKIPFLYGKTEVLRNSPKTS